MKKTNKNIKRSMMVVLVAVMAFMLFSSETAYTQWAQVNTLSNLGTYPSVSVVDQNVYVIAGGRSGTPRIYRTTNGGLNFSALSTTGITYELYCVWARSSTNIFVGNGGASGGTGGNARLYRTTNGGTSWTNVLSTGGTAGFFNGVVFSRSNPNFGIAQSDPPTSGGVYYLAKTTNGGTNWTVTNPPLTGTASAQNSVFCLDENFFGFGINTSPYRIYFTTNGGTDWNLKTLTGAGGTSGFVSTIAFNDNKLNGIAATYGTTNTISRTTDGGMNWFSQSIPCTIDGYANAKWVPGTNTVYIVVSNDATTQSFKSVDNGENWETYSFPSAAYHSWHMDLALAGSNANAVTSSSTGIISKINESPMPVTLESFTFNVTGRNVNLKWTTSYEENNYGFDVERMSVNDNSNWTKVGFVKGNGNTNNRTDYNFSDSKLNGGKYQYRIRQIDYNGNYEYFTLNNSVEVTMPGKFELSQNYPNPFNPVTKIDYNIPSNSNVKISLYDMSGKEVKTLVNSNQSAGFYTIQLNANDLSSGVYFYKMTANSNGNTIAITKKLSVIK
ncbi:MAG: T9SS type A sorting domain-containing protein [Ignavibacteriae bacterium]|nr:T9SS type A sorting domain-containing protein [Ignavibacteriota bacterium]